MTLNLLFFSVLKDITGVHDVVWSCAPETRVEELLQQVFQRWPELRAWDRSLLVAVDQTYVKRDAPLHEAAEVAIMPPVQGG
jgi:molybdopterin synthase sulfur carrier subunit